MIRKALPILAIGMTIAAGALAFFYNRDQQMLKAIKTKTPGVDVSGMTDAQKKAWAAL